MPRSGEYREAGLSAVGRHYVVTRMRGDTVVGVARTLSDADNYIGR